MALDGVYLSLVKRELEGILIGSRVDKIHQPSRDNLIISLRTLQHGTKKVFFSASAGTARVHLTESELENPKTPPMFCMLLRKHLSSAKLVSIRQDGFERILDFDFEATDEFGDKVILTLAAEIMGKYSNIILIGKDARVIDSIKRVSEDMSSVRTVLPGIVYSLPPREKRMSLFEIDKALLGEELAASRSPESSKALVKLLEGISPVFAREAVYYACHGEDKPPKELTVDELDRLVFYLSRTASEISEGKNRYVLLKDKNGLMKDFCFTDIRQYGALMVTKEFDSPSRLLDYFYSERDVIAQTRQRASDLFKLLVSLSERIARRVSAQKLELQECCGREELRLKGDLIMANLYRLEKGMKTARLQNYYDEQGSEIDVELDPRLTPNQNAQKYYQEYRKADTAEKKLTELISSGEEEMRYIDSVFDSLSRASTESELTEIRLELAAGGYVRQPKLKTKLPKALPPVEYVSSDGYRILVGRNNRQNDSLTLKIADKSDIWLHVQNITGAHVIIEARGQDVPKSTIEEAALIAAYNSSARNSSLVPVDYVLVRYVKKPSGAKPGMVIFTNNKTLYVTPDDDAVSSLRADKAKQR
ncbi:MAG TPA: NFACT family protein [Candidatus Faeciplasma pullistercoris]|uniref:Rqc2 homolog RqcH n=1 Tax=Candidatus Faeciplasma pullistercoris TaxID=2840800 RepID=A0A9D1GUB1_9FIRM|nr:NFACT family protein [Candidatus Faeciplasma pullistercoris]